MVKIKLQTGKFAIIDDCFNHLLNFHWYERAGYAVTNLYFSKNDVSKIWLHHCVIGRPTNKKLEVDHINGNGLDNRLNNLRIVTHRENMSNRKEFRDKRKTSKYVGVYLHTDSKFSKCKKWVARTFINNRRITIGTFPDEDMAFGAYLNFMEQNNVK